MEEKPNLQNQMGAGQREEKNGAGHRHQLRDQLTDDDHDLCIFMCMSYGDRVRVCVCVNVYMRVYCVYGIPGRRGRLSEEPRCETLII